MKITKFGHCCLLIEEDKARIIIDPGIFSKGQNEAKDIDLILITHGDRDHLDMDSLKTILQNNPHSKIITNNSVGLMLTQENISFEIIEDGQSTVEKDILIEGFGKKHAVVHQSIPQHDNTGYFIANKFFYPGDAYTNPKKHVEVLALTVYAPWTKFSESVDFAIELKPKICIPMHDGMLNTTAFNSRMFPMMFDKFGIKYIDMEIGKQYVF